MENSSKRRSATRPDEGPVSERATKKPHKPLREQALGGYWRVPAFALIGALLAFSISFIFKSQYSAVTRLIIHPNDSSYSGTDSGAETAGSVNVGGIDITKQTTLGNTLVNLTTSNEAVTEIVKRIGVQKINGTDAAPSLSTYDKVKNFLKVGGTGSAPTAEVAAVDHIKGSMEAVVLDESWVMEVTALDPDPKTADLIASTAADVAVEQSKTRFRENSLRELQYLDGQVAASRADLEAKGKALDDFKATLTNPEQLSAGEVQLTMLQGDLKDAQAAHSALEERRAAVAAIMEKPRFDVSRLGATVVSSAPARPLRYLFLLVGALVGALAGLLLTWFRSIREEDADSEEHDTSGSARMDDHGDTVRRNGVGRPDVRFEEVVDLRAPVSVPQELDVAFAQPPAISTEGVWSLVIDDPRDAGAVRAPDLPAVPPMTDPGTVGPQGAPAQAVPSVVGQMIVGDTLSATEAGSIASALFEIPDEHPSSG